MKDKIEKLAEELFLVTMDATKIYCELNQTDKISKELWCWLHMGFGAGIKVTNPDWSDDDLQEVIKLTIQKLNQ